MKEVQKEWMDVNFVNHPSLEGGELPAQTQMWQSLWDSKCLNTQGWRLFL